MATAYVAAINDARVGFFPGLHNSFTVLIKGR
jgi:hypothetical protein